MSATYSIVLCERPVVLGKGFAKLRYNSALSHPFLVLLDQENNPLDEIHGFWWRKGETKHPNKIERRIESIVAASSLIRLEKMVLAIVPKKLRPTTSVGYGMAQKDFSKAVATYPLIEGTPDKIHDIWHKIIHEGKRIHNQQKPYLRYRHNCQTVTAEILDKLGIDRPKTLKLAAPAWR